MSQAAADRRCLRIAAAGDIHCSEHHPEDVRRAFAALDPSADLLLLAGDLTTHGEPSRPRRWPRPAWICRSRW
ncbi:MAG: hypothetical protein M3Z27_07205 [Actinomycetota bacterium]|nr:hypothetical protein [Actinomycetota bacterium]